MKQETRKLDQALMYLVFVCVTLLAFSLGVFAGKEFSDQEYDLVLLNSTEYSPEKFASQVQNKQEPVAQTSGEDGIAELTKKALLEAHLKEITAGEG